MKAKRAAGLDQEVFDAIVSDMRDRLTAGGARLVSAGTVARAKKRADRSDARTRGPFRFPLTDGMPLGQLKLGALRSRMERLTLELKILETIRDRIGAVTEPLASVEARISESALGEIVDGAKEKTGVLALNI
jgi:hypothetical protein